MYSKKGESLVEVIVALSIFSFIFMGVVNIVASSITLNLSARQRTEVVSRVQKNLNEYLAGNSNGGACSIVGRSPMVVVPGTPTGCETNELIDSTQTCYWVELATLNTAEINISQELDNDHFIKVVSHGKWYTRILGEQTFEVSRILRNN